MTIYTDQVTGKQYDRMPGGVAIGTKPTAGYVACRECAFSNARKHGRILHRASWHCVSNTPSKTVFFVFKERKA